METVPIIIFSIYGLLGVTAIILLIIFIVQRIEAKKNETFEDRDN